MLTVIGKTPSSSSKWAISGLAATGAVMSTAGIGTAAYLATHKGAAKGAANAADDEVRPVKAGPTPPTVQDLLEFPDGFLSGLT